MRDTENKQISYLTLLLCYTLFLAVLTVETVLLDWDLFADLRLLAGLALCWVIHIRGKVPDSVKKWLYVGLMALSYSFYGIHETSLFDLAPVMIGIIFIYYAAGLYSVVHLCAGLYFLVLLWDMRFLQDGQIEFTMLNVSRLLLHSGLVLLTCRLVRLMADRIRREQAERDEKIAELEKINLRTEDFLANVSHELRTPINAVTGLTTVMLKNEEDRQKRQDLISVQKAGHRLFRQIEDILDYTEVDAQSVAVSEEDYMLSSLVNDLFTEIHMMENKGDLEIIFDVEAGIPSRLRGDERKIKKIVRHLLDNGIKFTEKGGVYVRIYALPKSYGINLCIRVSDTGIGIDAESLEKITERFYQSNGGRDRKAGGLGLGLPIVYGMALAMEGFVHVESQEGVGTTVTVSIPQKVADASPGMRVKDKEGLCLACYLKPEKYQVPAVRKYYDELISHIACELDLSVHRIFNRDELEKLIGTFQVTHLFLGREEYEEDPAWFEGLERKIQVVVVADHGFALPADSRVKFLPKPFSGFPIVNLLNSTPLENEEKMANRRMVCPDTSILVVDDEPMNRMVAEGIFQDYRMNVTTAGSGPEAIEICSKEDFDLVFLDHMMPGMDGVETLKHLNKLKTDLSRRFMAIAFTANAVSGAREMFLREGFDEFVSKPIEYPELERVLRKMLPQEKIRMEEITPKNETKEKNTGSAGNGGGGGSKENAAEATKTAGAAATPAPGEPDEMSRLAEAGIQTDSGLSYCRGDKDFYVQMLTMFVQEAERKAGEIDGLFAQKDYDNYAIQVHALKSTSKLLGANELSEDAKALEAAAKQKDEDYIQGHHEALIQEYRETKRRIQEAIGVAEEESDVAEEEPQGQEIAETELFGKLEELRESLDTFEADRAQGLLEELSGCCYNGKALKPLLKEARRDVEDFELEAASEKIAALAESLKGGES